MQCRTDLLLIIRHSCNFVLIVQEADGGFRRFRLEQVNNLAPRDAPAPIHLQPAKALELFRRFPAPARDTSQDPSANRHHRARACHNCGEGRKGTHSTPRLRASRNSPRLTSSGTNLTAFLLFGDGSLTISIISSLA